MGIIRETKGEYINFEITWLYQKIFFEPAHLKKETGIETKLK